MQEELFTWVLIFACLLCLSAGIGWQVYRRYAANQRPKVRRRVDRVARRAESLGAARVTSQAESAPEEPPVRQGVSRPVMLAVTQLSQHPEVADLYIQRALEVDEPFYRDIPISAKELEPLAPLFARNVALARVPGDGLSRYVYAINFSRMIQEAYFEGFMAHPNATAADLSIIALDERVQPLGEPMPVEDYGFGSESHVQQLWLMCNPVDKKHELDELLEEELSLVRDLMPRAKLLVAAVQGVAWTSHWDELFDLVRDVRRVGAQPGKAQERCERIDKLAAKLYAINARIDATVATMVKNIRTPSEADMALTNAVAYNVERELSVLFLRVLALIRVMSGDTYLHGIHCSSNIARNVALFPDFKALLARAREIAFDAAENHGRGLSEEVMAMVGQLKRDAETLEAEHDKAVAVLKADMARVQASVDQFLILQGRPRRFAVRLNADNSIAALMILEH